MNWEAYKAVFSGLGLSDLAWKIASAEIEIPYAGDDQPIRNFGFPPALIPLWSSGSGPSYYGYWFHWFVSRRPTIVRYSLDTGTAYEVASNLRQLMTILLVNALVVYDGVNEVVEEFAANIGFSSGDLALIDEMTDEHGDDPRALVGLSAFASDPPAEIAMNLDDYRGDFPLPGQIPAELTRYCGIEFRQDTRDEIAARPGVPSWLRTKDQKTVYSDRIRNEDLQGAWLSLNTSLWQVDDAREAIGVLSEHAEDARFGSLAAFWCSLSKEQWVDY
jgi:hypothetical protein